MSGRLDEVAKISRGRMQRLRTTASSATIRKGLDLPPGMTLYSDDQARSFVVLDAENRIITERSWEQATRWRGKGKTLSFVVRHDYRYLMIFGRPVPTGPQEEKA